MSINLASISPVLIKKYSYAFYSRASTFVRQIYDNGYSFTTGQRATPPRAQSIALSSPSASIMSSSSDSFSPAQSPCSSESSFDVSTPATPVTPMSTFSLSDHGSVGASKKGGLDMKTSAFPVIVQEDWSSEASMVHSQ